MNQQDGTDYYLKQKDQLLNGFYGMGALFVQALSQYFDESKSKALLKESRQEFLRMIPKIPYVGGDRNFLTQGLIESALLLPIFLILEREGLSLRQIAKISYETMVHDRERMPEEKKRKIRDAFFSDKITVIEKARAEESQKRIYAEDWVSEFVPGDGKTFHFGLDFVECGVCKYYKNYDAERFVPIICLGDYATYGTFGVGFQRKETLATGSAKCDFRFIKDYRTPPGWPPEYVEKAIADALGD